MTSLRGVSSSLFSIISSSTGSRGLRSFYMILWDSLSSTSSTSWSHFSSSSSYSSFLSLIYEACVPVLRALSIIFSNDWNPIMTAVMLSSVFCSTDSLSTVSTASPLRAWTESGILRSSGLRAESHILFMTSALLSFSNTPSQPTMIKSKFSFILKQRISGSGITTFLCQNLSF